MALRATRNIVIEAQCKRSHPEFLSRSHRVTINSAHADALTDRAGFQTRQPSLAAGEDLDAARWPLTRPPHLLETSRPGVFAVGDVRGGNIKPVTSAGAGPAHAGAFLHYLRHE